MITAEQLKNILNDEMKEFVETHHGVLNSGDMQTLAKFIMDHSEKIHSKLVSTNTKVG